MPLTYKAKNSVGAKNMHESWLKTKWVTIDSAFLDEGELIETRKSKNLTTLNGGNAIDIRVCDLDVTRHFGISLDSIVIDTLQKNPTLMRVVRFTQPPTKFKVKKKRACWGYKEEHLSLYEVRYDDQELYKEFNNRPVPEIRSAGSIEIAPLFDVKEIISTRIKSFDSTAHSSWGVFQTVKKSANRSVKKTIIDASVASESLIKVDILDLGIAYQSFVSLINSNVENNSR